MEQKSGNGNKEFPILFDFKERIEQFSIFRRKPQIVIILENGNVFTETSTKNDYKNDSELPSVLDHTKNQLHITQILRDKKTRIY